MTKLRQSLPHYHNLPPADYSPIAELILTLNETVGTNDPTEEEVIEEFNEEEPVDQGDMKRPS